MLALRWRGGDRPAELAIIGLTPFLALPLVALVVGAWRSRSAGLRVATALVLASFLVAMNPVSAVVGCGGEAPEDAVTIYTANVLRGGGRPVDIAGAIVAEGADVVVLQELTWDVLQELRADPRLDAYPHRSDGGEHAVSGKAIWSRWPLSDIEIEPFAVSRLVSATVESPDGPFRVANIHTAAPMAAANVGPWKAQFEQLRSLGLDQPRILAGDFNATGDHRPFRDLLDRGWTDVHEPKGCGYDATWPTGRLTPVPVYRLDHVLVTDHFEVLDVRLADPAGSDHRPVVAELRLRQAQLQSRALAEG